MLKLFPNSRLLIIGSIAAIFNALVRVAIVPLLVTPLIDKVFKQAQLEQLNKVLLYGFFLILFGAIMLFIQDASFASLAAKVSADSKSKVYKNLLKRPVGKLESSSGGLTGRILNDLKDIEIY
ncbi:MAG TPA: ABC transporter ATP-binding protein, partial [Trueperaceae bacterium]|nr:ABC transporter ATP-binding protein [Trueperaceae bacterium]